MTTSYGVGVIHNKAVDDHIHNLLVHRPFHQTGHLEIHGLGDDLKLYAGSGGFYNPRLGHTSYGVPYGTFCLSQQKIGYTIAHLYQRFGVSPDRYSHVWNVGLPSLVTAIGYDPGAKRGRGEIQIHVDSRLQSEGCLVLGIHDFKQLYEVMMKTPHVMKLEVLPTDNPHHAKYVISPRD